MDLVKNHYTAVHVRALYLAQTDGSEFDRTSPTIVNEYENAINCGKQLVDTSKINSRNIFFTSDSNQVTNGALEYGNNARNNNFNVVAKLDQDEEEPLQNNPEWLLVGEHVDDPAVYKYSPGKLLGFFTMNNGPKQCLLETTEFKYKQKTQMSCEWTRADLFVCDVDAIVNHCLIIPSGASENRLIHVWNRNVWGQSFFSMANYN